MISDVKIEETVLVDNDHQVYKFSLANFKCLVDETMAWQYLLSKKKQSFTRLTTVPKGKLISKKNLKIVMWHFGWPPSPCFFVTLT